MSREHPAYRDNLEDLLTFFDGKRVLHDRFRRSKRQQAALSNRSVPRSTSTILDRFSPGAMAPYSFIIREYGAKPLGAAPTLSPSPVDISVFSCILFARDVTPPGKRTEVSSVAPVWNGVASPFFVVVTSWR